VYRWVDHTAELEIEIEAASEHEVFADALRALAELLRVGAAATPERSGRVRRSVSTTASDRATLLAAWLEELVFLAESEGFVATELEALELDGTAVRATLLGVIDEPPPLVKAVTYHRLALQDTGESFFARVVLDV